MTLFVAKHLNTTLFVAKRKNTAVLSKILRYEPKEMANLWYEPTPHFMPICQAVLFIVQP